MEIINLLKKGEIEEKDLYIIAEYREKCNSLPAYSPTKEEKEIIAETTGISDEWLNKSTFKLMEQGKIDICTHESTWMCLMGREFLVDLDDKEAYLICEN